MREIQYVHTGIPGADDMLKGGLYPASAVLVSGPPGSGKSIFGMQYIHAGAVSFGELGLIISVEESAKGMSDYAASLGWDDWDTLVAEGRITIIGSDYFAGISLTGSLETLLEIIGGTKARRMVIDPVNLFKYYFPAEEDRRRYMLKFVRILKDRGITTLLVDEMLEPFPAMRLTEEMYLTDGNISLFLSRVGNMVERCFWVTKMRCQDIDTNIVPMTIGKGGIEVFAGSIPYSLASPRGGI
jgi:KaiC/GvpD/RAD55 family RecA-like ATPase